MIRKSIQVVIIGLIVVCTFAAGVAMGESNGELIDQVRAAENAFAKTMADRDHMAFATFLAGEAIFLNDGDVLRGKAAIASGWSAYFVGDAAPFSWRSADVVVLESGKLAHSSGPVLAPNGEKVGTVNSIWRRETDGTWKVVFDKGCPGCG